MNNDTIKLRITLSPEWLDENDPIHHQETIPTQFELDCIAADLLKRLIQNGATASELLRCYLVWKEHRELEEEQNAAQAETRWELPSIPLTDDAITWGGVRKTINELLMLHVPKLARMWYALGISMIVEEDQSPQ